MKRTCININFDMPGIHHYPNAEGKHSYLKYPHRHKFIFSITIEVLHDNRELEFFAFIDECKEIVGYMEPFISDSSTMSCEQIVEYLVDNISSSYPGRYIKVSVSEDGENTSICEML